VAVIIAPIVVQYQGLNLGTGIIAALLLGVLGWAVMRSKAPAQSMSAEIAVPAKKAAAPKKKTTKK
jgi:hypothetical protein